MVLRFLFHVGRAVANQGVGGIARALADPSLLSAGDLIGKIGADAWAGLRAEKKQDKLNADLLAAAKMDFAEIKRQAAEIAAQVAPNDPELRGHVERFVTLVPASIVASLKRPDDPTGTTLPYRYAVEDESDIVRLLPVRFPREHFKPGYAPPFLRGWELVEQLGAGGFGEVWLARNSETTNLVGAVKISHPLNDAELSLLNEGDVLNRLLASGQHPGIVAIQDNSLRRPKGQPDDVPHLPWIRYEYVPGGDLTGLMRRWAALPMEQRVPKVLAAFRELCDTVGHFHRLSPAIVHRDLKPSNILVTADGKLKIGDFGIGSVSAKRTLDGERRGTLSQTNTAQAYIRGAHTPLYAPPEQKTDPKHRAQPTDDVHALGVILFQMLTGRLDLAPGVRFEGGLKADRVPQLLIDLIGDCVETDKAKRPADAGAVLAKLTRPPKPEPDHEKEERDRRAREQAERERQAERDRQGPKPKAYRSRCPACKSLVKFAPGSAGEPIDCLTCETPLLLPFEDGATAELAPKPPHSGVAVLINGVIGAVPLLGVVNMIIALRLASQNLRNNRCARFPRTGKLSRVGRYFAYVGLFWYGLYAVGGAVAFALR